MCAEGLALSLSLLFPWRTRTDCKILGERGKGKGGCEEEEEEQQTTITTTTSFLEELNIM